MIKSNNISANLKNLMAVGFGVGLSWAGCMIDLQYVDKIIASNNIY